jgi:hypothetical protein
MPTITARNSGIAMMTSQAPWENFVTTTMTSTHAVTTAPTPLTTRARSIVPRSAPVARRSSLFQCRTIPACEIVKERNTPRMYSCTSRVTLASNTTMSSAEAPARNRMPLLKTSRSPRRPNWRGR